MGNGASFLRSQDDDDILGTDLDGSSKGVIKRIPIEMKPRGKLGNKITNSVLRKPKGGSLRYVYFLYLYKLSFIQFIVLFDNCLIP
jgi:hypothetical protein